MKLKQPLESSNAKTANEYSFDWNLNGQVALQFPDELLHDADAVASCLRVSVANCIYIAEKTRRGCRYLHSRRYECLSLLCRYGSFACVKWWKGCSGTRTCRSGDSLWRCVYVASEWHPRVLCVRSVSSGYWLLCGCDPRTLWRSEEVSALDRFSIDRCTLDTTFPSATASRLCITH